MSHKRSVEDKRRLKKLYEDTKNNYGSGVWHDEKKNRYIRYTCHNEWFKTHSRRIIRRKLKNSDILLDGNKYKKIYDYWWTVT